VNSCYFTMVAINEEGKPVAVDALDPATTEEKRRHAQAVLRKKMRLELSKRLT